MNLQINPEKIVNKAIIVCLIIILYFAFTSCASQRQKKAHRYFNENKVELAELCKKEFPIVPKYIKGDTITVRDTLKVVDTIPVYVDCPDGTKKECPPKEKKYIETVKAVTDTIVKSDERQEFILREEIKELKTDNKNKDEKIRKLTFALIGMILILIVCWILKK